MDARFRACLNHRAPGLRWRGCFLAHKTHTSEVWYHCTPQRQHFHTSSNAESNNLQVQGNSHNHLTAQRGAPNVISWPYYPAGGNWRTRFLHYYTCSRAWITSLLYRDSPWLKTIINTTGCMPTAGKTAVFYGSTSKQTILQGKFLHSCSNNYDTSSNYQNCIYGMLKAHFLKKWRLIKSLAVGSLNGLSCWTLHCCWCESAVSEVYNDIKLHCFTFNWHIIIGHESGVGNIPVTLIKFTIMYSSVRA